jgi:S-adenosylmethionine:tRNA ribosyltransferase-isomerase
LLHVGVGTFKPVETTYITDHQMHSEYIEIEPEVAERLNEYKKNGKRIIAIGTTSVRTLESFADENGILHA